METRSLRKAGGPFWRQLAALVLPIAMQNFFSALVSASDALMLGFLNQTALSAVSLAAQVQFVLSLFFAALTIGATVVIPFVLTVTVGKKKLAPADMALAADETEPEAEPAKPVAGRLELSAYLSGKAIPIEEVPDQVFSQKVLGDGLAIEPTDNVLLAPAGGEITVVNEGTYHACGILLDSGVEILLHIGLDTVSMNGDGFTPYVKEGQRVKRGNQLIAFDRSKIKAAGHPCVTVLVVTDDAQQPLQFQTGKTVQAGQDVILTIGA